MKTIVEVDRRPTSTRESDTRLSDAPAITRAPAVDSIADAVAALDDRRRIWEHGFEAGVRAATTTKLARGTRDDVTAPDDEVTAPYPVLDPLE